jgi:hypothetical protein
LLVGPGTSSCDGGVRRTSYGIGASCLHPNATPGHSFTRQGTRCEPLHNSARMLPALHLAQSLEDELGAND